MIRDLIWLLSIAFIAAGIGLMHIPTALIFLGLCCGVIAYFSHQGKR
jgi:hypothetical protein